MLTRFIRIQLAIFAVVGTLGLLAMALFYMQLPTLLGIGKITVKMDMPAAAGLYRFSNVTYRGVEIGKVTAIGLTENGARATMRLNGSPKVPADLVAQVRSVSAVGEQYVELLPNTDSGPYLHDGSTITMSEDSMPQDIGPMLDQLNALLKSIPKDRLGVFLDEASKGLNGVGFDFGSLIDSGSILAGDFNRVGDQTATLFEDVGPLLDTQAETADDIRLWSRSLAGFTEQLVINDPELRKLLREGPGSFDELSALLGQIKPTLPVLLANLTTIGQVGVIYNAGLRQLLVILPASVAGVQSVAPARNAAGAALGDFAITISDPPACTVGFLPPSQWRSPADTTTIDTPDGLYCKLPQDSPISVRGARNNPCMTVPGKRAPTAEMCYSNEEFQPLAMRQHYVGPYPFDPNLVGQGLPLDERVTFGDQIFAPVEGTPMPPGVTPFPVVLPPGLPPPALPVPSGPPVTVDTLFPSAAQVPVPGEQQHLSSPPTEGALPTHVPGGSPGVSPENAVPQAVPSASHGDPSVAVTHYDPRTGRYISPDLQIYQQSDLVTTPQTWQDMLPS